ncbi:MAG: LytR C-terminal domain-containing protein [Bifidobacteriaceae bacterium]|nr:LytR C-terminal domain-containing protein [Bifidobacteriaceae bacterium]
MSKNAYPFPPDEFDEIDPDLRPKEVHAARRSAWSRIWPFIVVIIVVPLLAFGVIKYLSNFHSPSDSETAAGTASSVSASAGATASASSAAPSPSASVSPSSSKTKSATPSASATPDRYLAVSILNATDTTGLAAKVKTIMQSDAWNSVTVGDYTGTPVPTTSEVTYSKNSQKVTATYLAGILHIDTVKKDTTAQGLTVVLAKDFVISEAVSAH